MQDEYPEEGEYGQQPIGDEMYPVSNQEQLGQDILRTFARTADPDSIVFKKVKRQVPVFGKKTILDEDGKPKQIEYIEKMKWIEWEVPVKIQPKYRELITDDIARSFLDDNDLALYRDILNYCKMIKSFGDRYEYDLSTHFNNWRDEAMTLIVSSGAYKGQRVKLAKSNVTETSYRANMFQNVGEQKQEKKKLLGVI